MAPIFIDLTEDQIEQLKPIMEKAKAADAIGQPGMAIAQIFPDELHCGFLPEKTAQNIQQIINPKSVGKTTRSGRV